MWVLFFCCGDTWYRPGACRTLFTVVLELDNNKVHQKQPERATDSASSGGAAGRRLAHDTHP